MEKLNAVIFSKDRACQLDLLLRSIERYVQGGDQIRFSILYTATTPEFDQGYERVRKFFPAMSFHDERMEPGDFKRQILRFADPRIPCIMFLVDDDLFKNPFSVADQPFRTFERDREQLCLSLRLGKHIRYCYSMDLPTSPPRFASDWDWDWKGLDGDWGYPMSLDGHIFRTTDLLSLLMSRVYSNPNTLEATLAAQPLGKPKMSCYEYSRIMNLPINKVQHVFDNRVGNVDHVVLNDLFLKERRRIRLEPFDGFVNVSVHQELPLEYSQIR